MNIALVQTDIVPLDSVANLRIIEEGCRKAAAAKAQLVLFPELCNIGQVPSFDQDFAVRYVAAAEPLDGNFLLTVSELAASFGLYIAVGLAEADITIPQTVYNTAALIDYDGQVVGVQRKLHLPGEERHYFARGGSVRVFDTELGRLTVQICYDLYFPEVARVAALHGAETLCGLANIPHREDWPDRVRQLACVRAYENMQHVALVNRVGEQHGYRYGGESVIATPPGRVLVEASTFDQTVIVAPVSSELLVAERVRRPIFADRRADVYGSLRPDPPPSPNHARGRPE